LWKPVAVADNQPVTPARLVAAVLLLAAVVFCSDKGFTPPPANPAATYPAHESHDDEKVAIALDPYDSPQKADAIFKLKYRDYGFLPVRLIITNDGDKPLMLDSAKIELITAHRDKIQPAVRDDIFRRIARPEKAGSRPQVQLPIPLPHGKAIKTEAREEVEAAMFVNVPVSPHTTNSGFLFFDVLGIDNPEDQAHVYISGIKAGSQELFYFDIPLQRQK
jgi:hypothetical protein